ncbi:MAG TPA: PilW family protein [Burkholderiales bacterium]|nr:PilW family protein [Burkholderiales bacterium]
MTKTLRRNSTAGFTLVELLVGVMIGLIGIFVIFNTFAVAENVKRTSTGGGDAQVNGSIGLFTLERDARSAGYGINVGALLGCRMLLYDEGYSPPREGVFLMVPVEITQPENAVPPGPANGPDRIAIMFGSSDKVFAPTKLTQSMPSPSADYKVEDRYGFVPGDVIVGAEPGKDCAIGQVSEVPGLPGSGLTANDNVIHNSGTYKDENGVVHPTRYNKPGGMGVRYSKELGLLYDLGELPRRNIYTITGSRLNVQNDFTDDQPIPILDNVVQLQAEYGKAADRLTLIVDRWDNVTPPAGSEEWQRIVAVRLALVARSTTPEKPDPDGQCRTTTAFPTWAGGAIDLSVTGADWQCYRYKVFQTIVPIRNMLWKTES